MTKNNVLNNPVSSVPIGLTLSAWDTNSNFTANSFLAGYTTTATAASTTTLTVASTYQQFFTGSTTQTVLLPVTSTLVLGQRFRIVNNSSGVVTVQSSGANTIQAMAANTTLEVTCILTSGTGTASWYASYVLENALTLPLSIANGGTAVSSVTISPTASSWAGWDAHSNLSANSFLGGYTTTATAGGTTVLTVSSTFNQFFTGVLTQTVTLPVANTLVLGQKFYIVNNSTGVVTVQSSGANTVIAMAASTAALITCILASGTDQTSWYAEYEQASLILPLSMVNGGTGAALTGSIGGILWTSSTTAVSVLAGTATARKALLSGATATPIWSTETYAVPGSANNAMISDGTNWTALATDPVIQRVSTLNVTSTTGTTQIPFDDTIPQNTEGDQYMTQAITPKNTANILVIEALLTFSNSGSANLNLVIALFQDSTSNALACQLSTYGISGGAIPVYLRYVMSAGTTSATTFKIRAGVQNPGTTTTNGQSAARKYGGVLTSFISVTEYAT